ncbi:ankyrin repeat, SAM and basic leucine zipper domain-containing protein 1-like isoform X2 [Venturia canescens]|uniref:ankyrin repeat, SAM and basic leucine zipper domain-containing protein 1-like isoform X2 n=1 Tax=Venturia canescens TaxID=32260 RepID=UPI001C9C0B59|nr:ankyrin repeat, SAM and basic leucine zipper domain-containing protein 1-like isoform X2 [Venturia canescens]
MACRPAGMSDDGSSDEDSHWDNAKNNKSRSNKRWSGQKNGTAQISPQNNNSGSPSVKSLPFHDDQARQEEQELQFRVLSACMSGNLQVINDYVKAGYNVNDYLHTGWTLLLYGASSMQPEVIELLIKLGANPNKNKDGYSPLMVLCDSAKGTEEQCLKCISILIEAKANPNAHNKLMKTALMFACISREKIIVEELLKHVNNIDAIDSDRRTALHYAALANKPDIVELLLKNNATRTITDRSDFTAKDLALAKGYDKIVALLELSEDSGGDSYCEVFEPKTWNDMFSDHIGDSINRDVAEMLYGMGLESYKPCFKGMSLKTFVKLTDDDLLKLGINVDLHRKQFLDSLHKFHTKAWSIQSIGAIKRLLPYTLYDGVALLGNAARQIGVIGSSFEFIRNGIRRESSKEETLTDIRKAAYAEELKKTEKTLFLLKKDLHQVLQLAKKIETENRDIVPANYIGKKEKKRNWPIIISVMLMTGMYLSKTSYVQRLWNN